MDEQFRIKSRPQLPAAQSPVQLRPQARQQDWGTAMPAPNADLQGLVQGLSSFNPAISKWAQHEEQTGLDESGALARANAEQAEAPRDALTGQPLPVPETIRPAFAKQYQDTLNEGLAQRVAVSNKAEAAKLYHDQKDKPDFDPQAFLKERREADLQGLTDPRTIAIIGLHHRQLEADVLQDFERQRVRKLEQVRVENATAWAADMFTGDQDPESLYGAFKAFQARVADHNISKAEAAEYLLKQATAQSLKLGGAPEMFDVFNVKDSDPTSPSYGKTLGEMNPGLAVQATQAKHQAQQMRDKAIEERAATGNARRLADYETRLEKDPLSITLDEIAADFAPHGAFRSPGQVAAMWGRVTDAQKRALGTQQMMGLFDSGELWRLEGGKQNQIMDARLGPLVSALADASKLGDQPTIQRLVAGLLHLHTQAGATVAFDQLKGYISHFVTTAPNKEGPTPGFLAAAEVYKAMSTVPAYRSMYFSEDAAKVMESFTKGQTGQDPKAAYASAYQAIDPAAKAAAEAFKKTPEFAKLVGAESQKWVTGSSMNWLKVFGLAGRPVNGDFVSSSLSGEMVAWRARNPFASTEDAEKYAEQWTASNFVMDRVTGAAVKVPPRTNPQLIQEAISEYSDELTKRFRLNDRNDADWSIRYVTLGDQGQFQPVLYSNGFMREALAPVNVQQMLTSYNAKRTFSPDERAQLGALKMAAANGSDLPDLPRELLAKAEMLGALKGPELKALRAKADQQLLARLDSIPKFTLGNPSAESLQLTQKGTMKVDNSLTATVARDLMASPLTGPKGHHMGLAASLVTMGETVALRAYDDPAQGAGQNIGMGYNLKANAKTVRSDLKRAMVPEDRIDDVLAGKADLTTDQAKRLLLLTLPRYEQRVREVAEESSPGLYDRMTPAQKAVMVDIAWQVGDPAQFRKAWESLAKGDTAKFAEETKVFYTARDGTRKEDVRRNNLRASMLAGIPHWEATVNTYGSLPSTKLAALGR